MNFSVLGAGRWGSFISWYVNKIGYKTMIWGRKGSKCIENLISNRCNSSVCFDSNVNITTNINDALNSEYIIISINSQNFRSFLLELKDNENSLDNKKIILCMKGIEEKTGYRLSQTLKEIFPNSLSSIWVGPGHVKSLTNGTPTCMVVDSENNDFKMELCKILSSNLIKCFPGNDLIGNEIGAACKNVLGIGAGVLDALNMESLKGPLMSLGAHEIASLIEIKGGKKESAFGLCHLGDFQATLFSNESNNRKYGESLVTGENISFVAEGVGTSNAIDKICKDFNINLPICSEIHKVIHGIKKPKDSILYLFNR